MNNENISLIRQKSWTWLEKNFDKLTEEQKSKFSTRAWIRIGWIAGATWSAGRLYRLVHNAVLELGKEPDDNGTK